MSENKSVLNWTFCQLLNEKPNCTKIKIAWKKSFKIFKVLLSSTFAFKVNYEKIMKHQDILKEIKEYNYGATTISLMTVS